MANLEKAAFRAKFIDRVSKIHNFNSIQLKMVIIIQIGQKILKSILML